MTNVHFNYGNRKMARRLALPLQGDYELAALCGRCPQLFEALTGLLRRGITGSRWVLDYSKYSNNPSESCDKRRV